MAKKNEKEKEPKAATSSLNAARKKGLESLFQDLEKIAGKGAGRPLAEQEFEPVERISTGSLEADRLFGGGVPRGRITEIFGVPSGGKTALCLSIIAECQRAGGVAAFIDAEQSFDEAWAQKFGVNTDALLFHSPSSGEEALNVAEKMCASGVVDLVVIDSVSMLVPEAELKGEMGDAVMGAQARMMSQAMRKLVPKIAKTKAALIFINQIREKIGVMFGSPETTSGGKALPFAASVRVAVRKGEPLMQGKNRIGERLKLRTPKNKTFRPFQTATVTLLATGGFDILPELISVGKHYPEIIRQDGSWFSYVPADGTEAVKIGQGKDKALEWLTAHPEAAGDIRKRLLAAMLADPTSGMAQGEESE